MHSKIEMRRWHIAGEAVLLSLGFSVLHNTFIISQNTLLVESTNGRSLGLQHSALGTVKAYKGTILYSTLGRLIIAGSLT